MNRAVIEGFNARQELREPPRRTTPGPEERVRFDTGADFDALTARALRMAGAVPEPYAGILKLLRGCEPAITVRHRRAEKRGASWRQLCAIAHRSGFTFEQR